MRAVSGPSNTARIAAAGVCIAAVAGFILWLSLNTPANAQRFALDDELADASCTMESWGLPDHFGVRKGETYRRVFKTPKHGFITVNCTVDGKLIEGPGSFHLVDGGLAKLTLKPDGGFEIHYEGIS